MSETCKYYYRLGGTLQDKCHQVARDDGYCWMHSRHQDLSRPNPHGHHAYNSMFDPSAGGMSESEFFGADIGDKG